MTDFISPRIVPDRDSKYMGLALIHAGFSKDPKTQMGAQIVSKYNEPLGSGYNGPPSCIDDNSFSWCRSDPDDPEKMSKYDIMIHAEMNAIKFSYGTDLSHATLYVTGFPCKDCMKELASKEVGRIVYLDYKSDKKSILQGSQRKISEKIADLARIDLEKFSGNLNWLLDWVDNLKNLGFFEMEDTSDI